MELPNTLWYCYWLYCGVVGLAQWVTNVPALSSMYLGRGPVVVDPCEVQATLS